MPKYPSEIFGFPHFARDSQAEETRARHWCPFVDNHLSLQLGRPSRSARIDVRPPTASGRVNEPGVDYPCGGLFKGL